ncbi:MAG: alpha/beta fold hydrolase [Aquabacterium sp.]|nr:MAG: alpha/beta fold hydrolase [Aquabacterium sp.]
MGSSETRFFIDTPDGHAIETFVWLPPQEPRAAVQIVHGMAEHARRYRHVAAALNDAGYAVYAAEHRGHGQSAQDGGTLGDFGPRGFDVVPDDMAAVSTEIHRRHPRCKLVMLAHSMGSFAAQIYLLRHAALVDGVALSGTSALDLLDPRISGWTVEKANAGVGTPRTSADWLSRDPAVPDAYVADPLCGFDLTLPSLFSIFDAGRATNRVEELRHIPKDLPLYLFTGDRDPVNGYLAWFDALVQRLREAGLRDVSTHVYGGARHEVLNETNRDEVIAQLLAWTARVTR